jgi:DNA-directed RNA polymerase subunit RPC12/RpoP
MFKNECPGSQDIKQPKPEEIKCRNCGSDVEIWTDESETTCKKCGKMNSRLIGPTCLDWCAFAKECVGEDKYRRIKAGASGKN